MAVKFLKKKHVEITRNVRKELHLLKEMSHDNINRFIGACVDPGNISIVTQFCARGSLKVCVCVCVRVSACVRVCEVRRFQFSQPQSVSTRTRSMTLQIPFPAALILLQKVVQLAPRSFPKTSERAKSDTIRWMGSLTPGVSLFSLKGNLAPTTNLPLLNC